MCGIGVAPKPTSCHSMQQNAMLEKILEESKKREEEAKVRKNEAKAGEMEARAREEEGRKKTKANT